MADRFQSGAKAGATDFSIPVVLRSDLDNSELTGVADTLVTAYYLRQGGTATSISVSALGAVDGAHADGGWIEVDATNMPGLYRFDLPDALFASGVDWVIVSIRATDAVPVFASFYLTTNEIQTGDVFAQLPSNFSLTSINGSGQVEIQAPINFDLLSINGSGQVEIQGPANFSLLSINGSGRVDIAAVNGVSVTGPDDFKAVITAGTLAPLFPANFLSMVIDASGRVDVGRVNGVVVSGPSDFKADVSSLSSAFPSNFASLSIDGSGRVDVAKVAGLSVTGPNDFKADITGLSTFDNTTDPVIVVTNNDKTAYELTAASVDAILDEEVETGYSLRELLRLISSALVGKVSGGGTANLAFRDLPDTKTRINMTVDSSGNRPAVTLDAT